MDHKTFDVEAKAEGDSGQFVAYASVFGNVDHVGDRMLPGAFSKTLGTWRKSGDPIPVILSHQHNDPMSLIGSADPRAVFEDKRGLVVQGKLDLENPTAKQVHRLMKQRLLKGWSFGYTTPPGGARHRNGANEISEVNLIEVGPTLKGANSQALLQSVKEMGEIQGKFDPKEPRDPHTGQWITFGGAGGSKLSFSQAELAVRGMSDGDTKQLGPSTINLQVNNPDTGLSGRRTSVYTVKHPTAGEMKTDDTREATYFAGTGDRKGAFKYRYDQAKAATITPEPVGHGGPLWNKPGFHLPPYIQHIANDLIHERGMTESRAIATAISRCKVWCAGGGGVKPDTKAKACAAVSEWEALKAAAGKSLEERIQLQHYDDIAVDLDLKARPPEPVATPNPPEPEPEPLPVDVTTDRYADEETALKMAEVDPGEPELPEPEIDAIEAEVQAYMTEPLPEDVTGDRYADVEADLTMAEADPGPAPEPEPEVDSIEAEVKAVMEAPPLPEPDRYEHVEDDLFVAEADPGPAPPEPQSEQKAEPVLPGDEELETAAENMARLEEELLLQDTEMKYDPRQPRGPHTGEWVKKPGGGLEHAVESTVSQGELGQAFSALTHPKRTLARHRAEQARVNREIDRIGSGPVPARGRNPDQPGLAGEISNVAHGKPSASPRSSAESAPSDQGVGFMEALRQGPIGSALRRSRQQQEADQRAYLLRGGTGEGTLAEFQLPTAPKMSAQDYRSVAGVLATIDDHDLANTFANALEMTNPKFDRVRFLQASRGKPQSGRDRPDLRPGTPTAKHFNYIADVLAKLPDPKQRDMAAAKFADYFASRNERFDRARFMRAAQGKGIESIADDDYEYEEKFDPNQARGEHTGQWVHVPGAVSRAFAAMTGKPTPEAMAAESAQERRLALGQERRDEEPEPSTDSLRRDGAIPSDHVVTHVTPTKKILDLHWEYDIAHHSKSQPNVDDITTIHWDGTKWAKGNLPSNTADLGRKADPYASDGGYSPLERCANAMHALAVMMESDNPPSLTEVRKTMAVIVAELPAGKSLDPAFYDELEIGLAPERQQIETEERDADLKAIWPTAMVNDLPDSAFLYIDSGGTKDSDGKTVPRSLRKFPYKGPDGKIDLPHIRNAIARIPQATGLSAEQKNQLQDRARRILDNAGSGSKRTDVVPGAPATDASLIDQLTDLEVWKATEDVELPPPEVKSEPPPQPSLSEMEAEFHDQMLQILSGEEHQ